MNQIELQRNFMKSNFAETDDIKSSQERGLPQPPLQKDCKQESQIIKLPSISEAEIINANIYNCLKDRRSRRKYKTSPLSLEKLSFLLWASQGVNRTIKRNEKTTSTFRPVPSAGARHPFETYLIVNNVSGLKPGIYRYLHMSHELTFLYDIDNRTQKTVTATLDQEFVGSAPVVFVWSCIPYRSEWRYDISAHKVMLLDAGHVCQNLYIACEAIGCGTCAIAAYNQTEMDNLLGIDGKDEFSVYLAPVGNICE